MTFFRFKRFMVQLDKFWPEFVVTLAIYNIAVGLILFVLFHLF